MSETRITWPKFVPVTTQRYGAAYSENWREYWEALSSEQKAAISEVADREGIAHAIVAMETGIDTAAVRAFDKEPHPDQDPRLKELGIE